MKKFYLFLAENHDKRKYLISFPRLHFLGQEAAILGINRYRRRESRLVQVC
jgi:hypothetical protein